LVPIGKEEQSPKAHTEKAAAFREGRGEGSGGFRKSG